MSRENPTRTSLVLRWVRFNFVGLLGVVVQMSALALLTQGGMPHLYATAAAVELAVIHNFLWHECYTWADRAVAKRGRRYLRFLSFNSANGAVSLAGNLLLMHLLVDRFGLPILFANGIAVLACSAVNFVLGESIVFRRSRRLCS